MRRRDFIRTTTALAGVLISPRLNINATAKVPKRVRKSITDLSPDAPELDSLKRAVKLMKDLDTVTPLATVDPKSWNQQAHIHQRHCPHENWWFLPWHRVYLHFFERICQVLLCDPLFALPYWDWTRYPYIPAPFLDKNGPLWDGTRGPNSNKQLPWESVGEKTINSLLKERAIVQVYGGEIDDDDQSETASPGALESVPHNGVHSAVGGDMGLIPCSPEDPLFWVHHCNVDRLWTSWQTHHGGMVPANPQWGVHMLKEFYDPDSKASRDVPCSQTVNSAEFIPQYDRLEIPAGCTTYPPVPAWQIWLGPGEQVTIPPGLNKVVISETQAEVRDNKTTFSIQMSADFERMMERAYSLRPDEYQYSSTFVLLALDHIPFPKSLSTMVRVFLDPLDQPGDPLRFDDPAYVQTFSFFAVVGNEKHTGTTFAFDITPNLVKMAAAGHRFKNKVQFTLFSVDPSHTQEIAQPVRPDKARVIIIE
jgi:hypothetical protein